MKMSSFSQPMKDTSISLTDKQRRGRAILASFIFVILALHFLTYLMAWPPEVSQKSESAEKSFCLIRQLGSLNGSKSQGYRVKEDQDEILRRSAPILLWRNSAHQEDVLVHSRS